MADLVASNNSNSNNVINISSDDEPMGNRTHRPPLAKRPNTIISLDSDDDDAASDADSDGSFDTGAFVETPPGLTATLEDFLDAPPEERPFDMPVPLLPLDYAFERFPARDPTPLPATPHLPTAGVTGGQPFRVTVPTRPSIDRKTPVDTSSNLYSLFKEKVLPILPNICFDFLRLQFNKHTRNLDRSLLAADIDVVSQAVILEVLDELNQDYPKRAVRSKKRKRSPDADSKAAKEKIYASKDRPPLVAHEILELRGVFIADFPQVPVAFIDQCLKKQKNLYAAYMEIETAMKMSDKPFRTLKKSRDTPRVMALPNPDLQPELDFVREKFEIERAIKEVQEQAAAAEEALAQKAAREGDVDDCRCCFEDEIPRPKLTHCLSGHPFCLDCAKSVAKAQIELQRYKIHCMDSSGCQAEFSRSEKLRFLAPDMQRMLERLQQQDELRKAGLEGLEECPRCDYAEIYPPIEVNKVFECMNEECDVKAICRLCRKDAHLPKTCEEYQKDIGVSERNAVAEAMSEAAIRKCPKCSVSIIKQDGCNKMTCSKCGCYFCDVCKKDITNEMYAHFKPGGKCQQTDNHVKRDDQRVKEAAEAAKMKVLMDRTDLKEEDISINFSDAVTKPAKPARPTRLNMPHGRDMDQYIDGLHQDRHAVQMHDFNHLNEMRGELLRAQQEAAQLARMVDDTRREMVAIPNNHHQHLHRMPPLPWVPPPHVPPPRHRPPFIGTNDAFARQPTAPFIPPPEMPRPVMHHQQRHHNAPPQAFRNIPALGYQPHHPTLEPMRPMRPLPTNFGDWHMPMDNHENQPQQAPNLNGPGRRPAQGGNNWGEWGDLNF